MATRNRVVADGVKSCAIARATNPLIDQALSARSEASPLTQSFSAQVRSLTFEQLSLTDVEADKEKAREILAMITTKVHFGGCEPAPQKLIDTCRSRRRSVAQPG